MQGQFDNLTAANRILMTALERAEAQSSLTAAEAAVTTLRDERATAARCR